MYLFTFFSLLFYLFISVSKKCWRFFFFNLQNLVSSLLSWHLRRLEFVATLVATTLWFGSIYLCWAYYFCNYPHILHIADLHLFYHDILKLAYFVNYNLKYLYYITYVFFNNLINNFFRCLKIRCFAFATRKLVNIMCYSIQY